MDINSVKLNDEIYISDAEKIITWLKDEDISCFLNEDKNCIENLTRVIERVNMPILTHLFNNNCRFFTIKNLYGTIGFLRLIPKNDFMEIVLAVGEKSLWGNGIGHSAVNEALKEAFINQRAKKVVAKIKRANHRSRNLFISMGFKESVISDTQIEYEIDFNDYCLLAA